MGARSRGHRRRVLAATALLGLVACSSPTPAADEAGPPVEVTSSAPSEVHSVATTPTGPLDLSSIVGPWHGEAETGGYVFRMRIRLKEEVLAGASAGLAKQYNTIEEFDADDAVCVGEWIAKAADPPHYEFAEVIRNGQCPNGSVEITHDPASETLTYVWTGRDQRWVGAFQRPGAAASPSPSG